MFILSVVLQASSRLTSTSQSSVAAAIYLVMSTSLLCSMIVFMIYSVFMTLISNRDDKSWATWEWHNPNLIIGTCSISKQSGIYIHLLELVSAISPCPISSSLWINSSVIEALTHARLFDRGTFSLQERNVVLVIISFQQTNKQVSSFDLKKSDWNWLLIGFHGMRY